MIATIQSDELKEKLDHDEPFYLVETLPAEAYHHAHLPKAINIPPDRISELAPLLLPDKSVEIIVYCSKPS
jgi:rhodanese-related sulfurtransferase